MMQTTYFEPELFGFLAELAANNSREWFTANRERYRANVQQPLLRFIADFAFPLRTISPHFVADARLQGGSMFRIHRDVRFSRDKTPYKTHAAAQFRHRAAGDVHAPGLYLHLEPGNCLMGAGVWHPDREALTRLRRALLADPEGWRKATTLRSFTRWHSLSGESLKRPPQGVDPAHELVEDLKRKDFVSIALLSEDEVLDGGFMGRYTDLCRAASPFLRYLCTALDLPFD